MKQYASRFLKSVAIFYYSFPISYIVLAAILFDIPLSICVAVIFSLMYLFTVSLAVLTGFGLWEMKRWSWYVFIATNLMIVYENVLLSTLYGESHHKAVVFAISLIFLILITYRVAIEIRVPYLFPKIRWWESDPRYRLSVDATLIRKDEEPLEGHIMDLSVNGCFIKLRSEVPLDELVTLHFTVFGYPIRCFGHVVWKTQSTVTHPRGVGIKFTELGKVERRYLRLIVRRLKKIAALYRRSRYLMSDEEFSKKLKELEVNHLEAQTREDNI